jgi:SSS family solute:Na+ symporter
MGALQVADWLVIGAYLAFTLLVGLFFSRRSGKKTEEFFLSGRTLPWWLAGTSMVATTFGSDTPLLVAGIIGQRGIAGNWWWWSFAMSNMLTVFFFARLWRRSGLTTDVELCELRYGGAPARILRGTRALYFGGLINILVLAWILFGGQGILATLLGIAPNATITFLGLDVPLALSLVVALVLFVTLYSTLAGLWGVVTTDLVQFGLATVGCVALAIYVVNSGEVGGLSGLRSQVIQNHPAGASALSFFPQIGGSGVTGVSLIWFSTMMGAQWWASWYPGSEPGGGGYIAQRMLASKDERHAQLATLWFSVAHYAVRPWPWILVALASFAIWPDVGSLFPADWGVDAGRARELTFIAAIPRFLPTGLAGLMAASLVAALMSTVDTHMNWGASYLVNDFYRRFWVKDRDERHYVRVSRLVMLGSIGLAILLATTALDNIRSANELVVSIGAGAGLVYILRWFWPRINAWSEIASMLGAFAISQLVKALSAQDGSLFGFAGDDAAAVRLLATIVGTTALWLGVTFLTPREDDATLEAFYKRCRPPGPGWQTLAIRLGLRDSHARLGFAGLADWVAGCMLVWAAMLAVGKFLLGNPSTGTVYGLVAAATSALLAIRLRAR